MNITHSSSIRWQRQIFYLSILSTLISASPAIHAAGLNLISRGNLTTPLGACSSGALKYTPMCLIPDIVDNTLQDTVFTCNKGVNRGTSFVGSETEPSLAVNPLNPNNIVAMWQQDRWARLGGGNADALAYSMDGGQTWTFANPMIPLTRCAGATEDSASAYDRNSDPWVVYDKKGTLYAVALAFDGLSPRPSGAVNIAKSTTGGATWQNMNLPVVTDIVTKEGNGSVPILDKEVLTPDPVREGPHGDPVLYTTWALFQSNNKSDLYLSRSFDGGTTWEIKKKIYTMEKDLPKNVKTISATLGAPGIEVLYDGTLVNIFNKDIDDRTFALIRSFDGGNTWESKSTEIAKVITPFGLLDSQVYDPEILDASGNKIPIRDAIGGVADSALSPDRKIIYVAYQSADPKTGLATVLVTRSTDRGSTWSTPVKVNNSSANAFEPVIHVAPNGTVGVLYVDMRNDVLGSAGCGPSTCGPLSADMYLAQFSATLQPKGGSLNNATTRVTPSSLDYRQAPLLFGAGGVVPGGFFLGDYQGLDYANGNFVMAITVTNNLCSLDIPQNPNAVAINECNRNDIYFAKVKVK